MRVPHPAVSTPTPHILIVGAGITGLALAHALRRAVPGAHVDVVERSWAARSVGAGLYLPGNAARALRQLGLWEPVAALAHPVSRQAVQDADGETLSATETNGQWGPNAPSTAMRRADLHRLLLAVVGPDSVRHGVSPVALHQGRRVRVDFSDHSDGEYDLVVGADGIQSWVRAVIAPGVSQPRSLRWWSWRFLGQAEGFDGWTVRLGERSSVLTVKVAPSQVYCYLDMDLEARADGGFDKGISGEGGLAAQDSWRCFMHEYLPQVRVLLEGADLVHHGPLHEVSPPVWSSGRILLAGDAAHASSPNTAQGVAMALEDALVLARLVAKASLPTDLDHVGAEYAEARDPRLNLVQEQTRQRDVLRRLPPQQRARILRQSGRTALSAPAPLVHSP